MARRNDLRNLRCNVLNLMNAPRRRPAPAARYYALALYSTAKPVT